LISRGRWDYRKVVSSSGDDTYCVGCLLQSIARSVVLIRCGVLSILSKVMLWLCTRAVVANVGNQVSLFNQVKST